MINIFTTLLWDSIKLQIVDGTSDIPITDLCDGIKIDRYLRSFCIVYGFDDLGKLFWSYWSVPGGVTLINGQAQDFDDSMRYKHLLNSCAKSGLYNVRWYDTAFCKIIGSFSKPIPWLMAAALFNGGERQDYRNMSVGVATDSPHKILKSLS